MLLDTAHKKKKKIFPSRKSKRQFLQLRAVQTAEQHSKRRKTSTASPFVVNSPPREREKEKGQQKRKTETTEGPSFRKVGSIDGHLDNLSNTKLASKREL
ncbi:hypothetical protein niasHT_031300 [Heterodera trifolii]|uniref:Uncharacterized protein n=1 Tax=Heterodera trifolii TaxID=157864 RepID=A0ABD2I3I9_9BILA